MSLRRRLKRKLGATGQHPDGKLNADDEGEIAISVGSDDGNVIMEFGTSVKWLGFPPGQAREIATMLIKHADSIEH